MLFWGRWGTPIPYRVPVHVVVGEPLTVTQDPNPSDDAVAAMLGASTRWKTCSSSTRRRRGALDTRLSCCSGVRVPTPSVCLRFRKRVRILVRFAVAPPCAP